MQAATLIDDRFEIGPLAGSGGMGEVYRARDRATGEDVAVKVLSSSRSADATRFVREAEVLASLRHPGIVRYVAHGAAGQGHRYLAMEWLDGEDLAARLATKRLTIAEALAVVRIAAEALAVAHERGVVHRDVKPGNIFLVGGSIERVKVLDFGVAHLGRHVPSHTATGVLVGTPEYMAPEQARGDREIGAAADVFALGCVLFECLTGRSPFHGEHVAAVLAKILLEDPPRVGELCPGVPDALDALVARMLAKNPAERPIDAAAVVQEMASIRAIARDPRLPASVPPESITRGEQRLVSVIMISDPKASDPAIASAVTLTSAEAARAAEPLRAAVEASGARLELLPGGSIVATLAGGIATDLAASAARCALEIARVAPDLQLAIATGRAELSGRLPVGHAIDRAVRMIYSQRLREPSDESAAGSDKVVTLDEVTAGLLGARFDVGGDETRLTLRGERELLDMPRTLGRVIPCVGRDRELSVLEGLFGECAEEELARAVIMSGPPGIGKSRVRQELLDRIARRGGAEVWAGRGDAMAAGSAFSVVGQALRSACGIQAAEPLAARQRKLRARAARHVAAPEVQRVTEFLGEVAGAPFPDEASVQLRAARRDAMLMGDQIRRAWGDFLDAECAAQPVVLVLEDMQWGDLPSVRLVEGALRKPEGRALLVIAVGRPEMHKVFPEMWSHASVHRMSFGPLTKRASERLVREVLGDGAGDAAIGVLVERSAGNPLYIEELARAAANGNDGTLPETVLAMMEARLEGFEGEARRVLRAASLFGQTCWKGGVSLLLGGAGHVVEWLEELEAREILCRRSECRFPGEVEYTFRHALLCEAAYAMLTESDRTLGHRLAGRWLERMGETDAMALAGHFERGQMPAAAASAYLRAAQDALHANDFEGALARVRRGIECLDAAAAASHDAETVELRRGAAHAERSGRAKAGPLLLLQAEVHRWRGEFPDAERCALEAMELLSEGSEPWYRAGAEGVLASSRLGRMEPMVEVAERLCRAFSGATAGEGTALSLARAASQLVSAGRYDLADQMFAQIDAMPGVTDPAVLARIADARARRVIVRGDLGEFLRLKEVALASAEEAGDARMASVARISVGFARIELGAYASAERVLSAALESAERMGLHGLVPAAKQNLGIALAMTGRAEEARAVEQQALEAFRAQGHRRMESASHVYLSCMLAREGDMDGAEQEARLAVETAPAPPLRAQALAALSQVLLARGQAGAALSAAREAMEILDRLGAIEEGESLVRLAHAEAAAVAGDPGAAASVAVARDRLLARAEKITDPDLSRSFLENVPENARTLALARAHCA